MDFETGQQLRDPSYRSSSFTDEQALEVWDAIIKPIRLRPGAV